MCRRVPKGDGLPELQMAQVTFDLARYGFIQCFEHSITRAGTKGHLRIVLVERASRARWPFHSAIALLESSI